jgi:hypothetical protein
LVILRDATACNRGFGLSRDELNVLARNEIKQAADELVRASGALPTEEQIARRLTTLFEDIGLNVVLEVDIKTPGA